MWTLDGDTEVRRRDSLVTEEPVEIRLSAGGRSQTVAVTMRTPGHDFELAAGFLHAEGLLPGGPRQVSYCADVDRPDQRFNVVTVESDGPAPDGPVRTGIVSSACGVCGSASLDAVRERGLPPVGPGPEVPVEVLYGLPDALRSRQGVFDATGGLHAAGLFDAAGGLIAAREDVGRHNAVDKLVGWGLLNGRLPLAGTVLMVSGRCGYEIVQKAVAAGIPCGRLGVRPDVAGRGGGRGLRRHPGRLPAQSPLQRVRAPRPHHPPRARPARRMTTGAGGLGAYDVVVLTGGRGSRLGGVDKAGLAVGGVAIGARVLAAVPDAGRSVVVGEPVPGADVVVREEPVGGGPVAGLAAGLAPGDRQDGGGARRGPAVRDRGGGRGTARGPRDGGGGAAGGRHRPRPVPLRGLGDRRAAGGAGRGRRSGRGPAAGRGRGGAGGRSSGGRWRPGGRRPGSTATRSRIWRPHATGPGAEMGTLQDWTDLVTAELGIGDLVDAGTRDQVLDLTKDVAHGVARPAAPLTAYLMGLAVGRGADPAALAARLSELATTWTPPAEPAGSGAAAQGG